MEKPRDYELVCVFNVKENNYATGLEGVKKVLANLNCPITKEEDKGNRELAYLINKEDRGHYHIFYFTTADDIFAKLDDQLKLQATLIRHLLIRVEAPSKKKPRKVRVKHVEKPADVVASEE